ncbi:hypothetical protein [Pseudomonas fitomaticsae]|uniref:Uncharacterized protein n=1 Tax=Pseudomonas fitomaticsae TaxID=2837969 RepID=A0ABY3PY12_9PSED|nr:hypothetical protein [Pseudomonas fitomaticsae]UFP98567.1 hypothetical protein KJY40_21340 [Pseudomonas fitomaticsae]
MITALQKLFHRLTDDRSSAPGHIVVRLPQSAGASTDETMNVEVKNEAQRIAASIRDYPEDWSWSHKGYELQHTPTGFTMWVANEDYGLAEVSSGHKAKFAESEAAIIWPAVAEWLAQRKVGFTGKLPKVAIHFANGHYWCLGGGHPWAGAGNSPAEAYRSWSRAVSIQARTDTKPNEVLHVWSAAR